MKLNTYLDLQSLLEQDGTTQQERRAFGLKHTSLQEKPVAQLAAWVDVYKKKLVSPRQSEKIDKALYHVTLFLVILAFLLGLVSGIGLLSYNGKEPVNLIYFLGMVVAFPLLTMTLTLFAMLRANRSQNMLVHISPAYWMERLWQLFSKESGSVLEAFAFNPLVLNWIIIRRSQMVALAFSLGLFFALLGVVATRDVAFAWSTTLDVSDTQFHTFLNAVAFPWRLWLPSAVPSLELVSQSHYFRLGGKLSETMVSHAELLGTWWRFLAMATLFYAVILRMLFYLIATWGVKRAIRQAMLTLDGVQLLLKDMNEPVVTTQTNEREQSFSAASADYNRVIHTLDKTYDMVQGWAISHENLTTLCDAFGVSAQKCVEVGGNNTLAEDMKSIKMSQGSVLLLVKAWEPPTMDFVDHLQMLTKKADKVVVMPVGTAQTQFQPAPKQTEVWLRKIAALDNAKVWIKL